MHILRFHNLHLSRPDLIYVFIVRSTIHYTEALELLNEDFDIGLNIKEKLIPKAVLYFTGEIGDLEMDDDDDDDEFGDEDSDSD